MPKGPTSNVTRKTARRDVAGKTAEAADVSPRTGAVVVAPSEADVARRAYEIYLEEGRPDGRQIDHWLRAESELRSA
jgi:hypothetical protein